MSANSIPTAADSVDAGTIVEELKTAWRNGQAPNAAEAIREHPSILANRSLVIDLAYEEYCLREESGATPDADSFCATLPAFRSQVREVIRGHRELADHPEILAHASIEWPVVGESLDGMPLIRELGRGAFARVFLATDPTAGERAVVLKVSQLPSPEANTLGPIEHENVVGIHWAKQIDGLFVICMPFVAATTIQDLIDGIHDGTITSAGTLISSIEANLLGLSARPSTRQPILRNSSQNLVASIIEIATPLASALAFLHRRGICHGDLKPSNILLGPGGVPFLIDFNLASATEVSGLRMGGTLPYMAPERIRALLGQTREMSRADRADVYSFAAVLYECLCGEVPFVPGPFKNVRGLAEELMRKKIGIAPSLRSRNSSVPRWLSKLVERCLDANPTSRPTAAQIENEFRMRRSGKPNRKKLVVATAFVVLGAITSQFVSLPSQSVIERASVPRDPAQFADPFERGIAYLDRDQVAPAMLAFDEAREHNPDGRTFAYLGYCHSRGAQHEVAVECYKKAIELGFVAPWVHNNRAYSLTQTNRNAATNLPVALNEVSLAFDKAGDQRDIKLNWVYIRYLSKYDSKTKRFIDDKCIQVLEEVMADGPYDADLYYKAAVILAAGSDSEASRCKAISYLTKAIELGKRPTNLAGDPVLKANLGRRSDFKDLLALSPGSPNPNRLHLGLVNPSE